MMTTLHTVMVQWKAQEEGCARNVISERMKTINQDARVWKSARAWEDQEDSKKFDVQYIDGYVESKPIQWTVNIHFRYEALYSREQWVARLLGQLSWPFTMTSLGYQPGLAPTICTYREYLSLTETDPFSGGYEAVLDPYRIDPMNAVAAQTPASVPEQIYTANQHGDPTAFLLWHATPRLAKDWDPGRISLLHSVSHYASRMGGPYCKWEDRKFAKHWVVSYGTPPLPVWEPY